MKVLNENFLILYKIKTWIDGLELKLNKSKETNNELESISKEIIQNAAREKMSTWETC